jgi:hypothetical protein
MCSIQQNSRADYGIAARTWPDGIGCRGVIDRRRVSRERLRLVSPRSLQSENG